MKEQIKEFWKENKEKIKTGALLVVTPIAVLGLMATKSLGQIIDMAHDEHSKGK